MAKNHPFTTGSHATCGWELIKFPSTRTKAASSSTAFSVAEGIKIRDHGGLNKHKSNLFPGISRYMNIYIWIYTVYTLIHNIHTYIYMGIHTHNQSIIRNMDLSRNGMYRIYPIFLGNFPSSKGSLRNLPCRTSFSWQVHLSVGNHGILIDIHGFYSSHTHIYIIIYTYAYMYIYNTYIL